VTEKYLEDGGTSLSVKNCCCRVRECLEKAQSDRLDEKLERVPQTGSFTGENCMLLKSWSPSGSSVLQAERRCTVTILKSGSDMGQGNDTLQPSLCRSFPIGVCVVTLRSGYLYTPDEKSATGSRLTFNMGRA
jgi:hypothetical protein